MFRLSPDVRWGRRSLSLGLRRGRPGLRCGEALQGGERVGEGLDLRPDFGQVSGGFLWEFGWDLVIFDGIFELFSWDFIGFNSDWVVIYWDFMVIQWHWMVIQWDLLVIYWDWMASFGGFFPVDLRGDLEIWEDFLACFFRKMWNSHEIGISRWYNHKTLGISHEFTFFPSKK